MSSNNPCQKLKCTACCREISFRVSKEGYNQLFKNNPGVENPRIVQAGIRTKEVKIDVVVCPQLSKDGSCSIYNDLLKPQDCRRFAFGGERCRYLRQTTIENRNIH